MSTYRRSVGDGLKALWHNLMRNRQFNRGAAWGLIIISALLAFEVFNFSTTQFALRDILGDLQSGGMSWATILAIAFCGIDFAGIARIFTPEQGRDEPAEVYYLFGAWLLAAGFNATLTWWGVSVAVVNHASVATTGVILSSATMTKAVPIFVAVMVWLIRVLLIGTFSLAGDRLFTTAPANAYSSRPASQGQQFQRPTYNQPVNQPVLRPASSLPRPANSYSSTPNTYRPAPKPTTTATQTSFAKPEPTYHPVSFGARPADNSDRNYDA
jgi:hypothetical protein